MTSVSHVFLRVGRGLSAALAICLLGVPLAHADVATGEKSGFIGRIFGGEKKETPPPAPPPAPPAPAPKPAAKPSPTTVKPVKRSTITIKPGSGGKPAEVVRKSSTPAKKPSTPAPVKKTETVTPAKEPEPKMTEATAKDAEFGNAKEEAQVVSAPEPSAKLPSNAGWQIVKVDGRDYITGDSIHQFYRFSSYKVDGKHVWLRSNNLIMKGSIGSKELLINNIKFILSYPVLESSGRALFSRLDLCKLIDPVLRPTYINDAVPFDTVVIDAGHGGHDVGARGIYGYEKDFALKMAHVLRDVLTRRGFKVVMTRSNDTFIPLSGRVAVANATPNSIFISLHFNAGDNNVANGIETFALTPQGSSASLERGGGYNARGLTGNAHDSANIALATAVHAMVISKFKFVDRGIKRAQWSVLTGCKRPGILFEGGFVTNNNECRLIASDTYRQSVATAIADAIVNYRTALRGALTRRQ